MLDWQVEVALARYNEQIRSAEQRMLEYGMPAGLRPSTGLRRRAMRFAGGYLVAVGRRMQTKAGECVNPDYLRKIA